ncbi:MAG TPA: hypothetical protein VFK02_01555 [Kofleriaceae bacterium]|nr:hypothetical protein [Kofleriaceae bacterium]
MLWGSHGAREEVRSREVGSGGTTESPPSPDQGRTQLGFVLEASLRARRMVKDRQPLLFEVGNGATVLDGDGLQLYVRTSKDAYVYLAFCSRHAADPRVPGLKVFPDTGALLAHGYETAILPDRAAEIVLDDTPGPEALYVVLSQSELSTADTELAQLIVSARRGHERSDCTQPLAVHKDGRPSQQAPRKVPAPGPRQAPPKRHEAEPVVEIQRGGDIVWKHGTLGVEADPDGIVVLRYGLNHLEAPRVPPPAPKATSTRPRR